MDATPTYTKSKAGFPLVTCGRCGGAGEIAGYRNVQGGVCFGCGGSGSIVPSGAPAKLAAEWNNVLRAARACTPSVRVVIAKDGSREQVCDANVGDVIRVHGDKGAEWRTIAAIRPTRYVNGEWYEGHPQRLRGLTLRTVVEFTDGTTRTMHGELWTRRPDVAALTALCADLAGRACEAYERTLARRTRRAA